MARLEPVLLALFFASWVAAILGQVGLLSLAGLVPLGLYGLFGLAAFLGWLSGNVYLHRRRHIPRRALRRRVLLVHLLGPPGLLYLLREMAPAAEQQAAPLVAPLAFAVYAVFILVPLTLAGDWSKPRRP